MQTGPALIKILISWIKHKLPKFVLIKTTNKIIIVVVKHTAHIR